MLGYVISDVSRAERALYRRTSAACDAAVAAGVSGRFLAWEHEGLFAVLVANPGLGFLSTVTGVVPENVPSVLELLDSPVWQGIRPTVVVQAGLTEALLETGLRRTADRGLALRTLDDSPPENPRVIDADGPEFVRVLLAGFEVGGPVADYIEAEHQLPTVRRFLAVHEETPIAAAAMTIHGEVAVLGSASTLRAHRGRGAQTSLLRHRLHLADLAGCTLAVGTAVPDSVSAANLMRAGFQVHRRAAFQR
jgi:hypothetical protein